jgi:hypothetical protein
MNNIPHIVDSGASVMRDEPVAWIDPKELAEDFTSTTVTRKKFFVDDVPLYLHPVKELTDEEIDEVAQALIDDCSYCSLHFARAILRKAQEKC